MRSYSPSERTKRAVIQAAGELLAERGVGRVSTRAIAERAGVNLGTIHYHFGSKDGLLKEVLRYACNIQGGPTLPELLRAYEDHLDDIRVQVEAVRTMVQHLVRRTLSPERPRWCSHVLYQVAQHKGTLHGYLREQTLDPFFDAITCLIRRICPQWTAIDILLWLHMTVGPIVFHAVHGEVILDHLDSEVFPVDYLDKLEQRSMGDALRALGLPTGDTQESHNQVRHESHGAIDYRNEL